MNVYGRYYYCAVHLRSSQCQVRSNGTSSTRSLNEYVLVLILYEYTVRIRVNQCKNSSILKTRNYDILHFSFVATDDHPSIICASLYNYCSGRFFEKANNDEYSITNHTLCFVFAGVGLERHFWRSSAAMLQLPAPRCGGNNSF